MDEPSPLEIFGNKVRVRTCGLCWDGDSLLMVNHQGLYPHDFWSPPGGGLEFGQSARHNLEREFREETGLEVRTGEFLFVCEFINPPLHAMEIFFSVEVAGGRLTTGRDPELTGPQLINSVKYLSQTDIRGIPETHKHGIFRIAKRAEKIRGLRGYLKI